MLIICWAAKGGSGTTVVSCALALLAAQSQPTLLIDLAGDASAALGIAEHAGLGVHDWVLTPAASPSALQGLSVQANDQLRLVPAGAERAPADDHRWSALGAMLATSDHITIIDAGTGEPPEPLLSYADQRLLVTQACYLALRRHAASQLTPTGVVLMQQVGRALRADDIVHAVRAPVVAAVDIEPSIARAVDAGLLASRLPRHLATALRALIQATVAA